MTPGFMCVIKINLGGVDMPEAKRVRFLDPADVSQAIAEIARLSLEGGIDLDELAIIGGVAMVAHGSDRFTRDVDLASYDDLPPGLRIVKQLAFGGVSALTPAGHPVDVVVRSDDYRDLYCDAIDHATDVGFPLRVVTAEFLVALKMAAARDKDVLDLKKLVSLGIVNLAAAREIVGEHLGRYAARELDKIVVEVAWLKSREG